MSKKQIHFYPYEYPDAIADWNGTHKAINDGIEYVETMQMGLLSADLWELGYRIFIHEPNGKSYELKLGGDNERTDKELRIAHNLFKMWRAGSFNEL